MAVVLRCLNSYALKSYSGATCAALRHYSKEEAESVKEKLVDVQVNDLTGVATVTMQNKPVNVLSTQFLSELGLVINQLEKSKCRGMILTSAMPTVFSAGLNIQELYEAKRDNLATFWGTLQSTWLSLYRSTFPTVAVINGACPAGGCLVAMSCEYRVMVGEEKFKIGLNETKLGIIPPEWFYLVMKNVIGNRQTEMALTRGHMFSPNEALKVGLIDEIVSNKEDGLLAAEKFVAQFEKISPVARKLTKELSRAEAIKFMEENSVEDIQGLVDFVSQPFVQKGLGLYLQSLKK